MSFLLFLCLKLQIYLYILDSLMEIVGVQASSDMTDSTGTSQLDL